MNFLLTLTYFLLTNFLLTNFLLINVIYIANQFNNIFCYVAPTIQSNINLNFKSFDQFLTEPCKESFLISPCTKNEILEIISSLDYNKAVGINSIPIKILKLAKEQIAEHLCFYTTYLLQQVFFQTV